MYNIQAWSRTGPRPRRPGATMPPLGRGRPGSHSGRPARPLPGRGVIATAVIS